MNQWRIMGLMLLLSALPLGYRTLVIGEKNEVLGCLFFFVTCFLGATGTLQLITGKWILDSK